MRQGWLVTLPHAGASGASTPGAVGSASDDTRAGEWKIVFCAGTGSERKPHRPEMVAGASIQILQPAARAEDMAGREQLDPHLGGLSGGQ